MAQRTAQPRGKADRYVRPPLVAKEPPSQWAEVWRFRIVALILLAAFALLVLYVARHLINTEQNPTFGAAAGARVSAASGSVVLTR